MEADREEEMVNVRVDTGEFSMPLSWLAAFPDSLLSRSRLYDKQLPPEPFPRSPELFVTCVMPFYESGGRTIPIPAGLPVSVVAAEFDYFCLPFEATRLQFADLREGLQYRFLQFVQDFYEECIAPEMNRLLIPPFRNALLATQVRWVKNGKPITEPVLRRIFQSLAHPPFNFTVSPQPSPDNRTTTEGVRILFPLVPGETPVSSRAAVLGSALKAGIESWFQDKIRSVDRDPREHDLLSWSVSVGQVGKNGGADQAEPVLAQVMAGEPYGFLAKMSQRVAMYGMPAEWLMMLTLPETPLPHTEAAVLRDKVTKVAEAELDRVAACLGEWTDFTDLPRFTYATPFVTQFVTKGLASVHGIEATVHANRTVIVDIGLYNGPDAQAERAWRTQMAIPPQFLRSEDADEQLKPVAQNHEVEVLHDEPLDDGIERQSVVSSVITRSPSPSSSPVSSRPCSPKPTSRSRSGSPASVSRSRSRSRSPTRSRSASPPRSPRAASPETPETELTPRSRSASPDRVVEPNVEELDPSRLSMAELMATLGIPGRLPEGF
eukprot:TRINITY_DN8804_c0_g1_i1.p1 TRINITY_DN8804_c0_g1~~TRINITY_DN8804_c0_g1_i1.p1  ORF type:complete len:549 (+),score=54.47 TRINITY_DN8804_c0_g1_i1:1158-2804(+)